MNCTFWSVGNIWLQSIGHLVQCRQRGSVCYLCPQIEMLPMCPDCALISSKHEAIADTGFGEEVARLGRIDLELLP